MANRAKQIQDAMWAGDREALEMLAQCICCCAHLSRLPRSRLERLPRQLRGVGQRGR